MESEEAGTKINVSEDEKATFQCLDIIGRITCQLKSETNTFPDVLEKLLAVVEGGTEKRELVLQLIQVVLSNVMDTDTEELILLLIKLKNFFDTKIDRKFLVEDSAIKLIHPIREGLFGVVFHGLLTRPGKFAQEVAIKKSAGYEYNKIIEREAVILSRLTHKNIVKMYAVNTSHTAIVREVMQLGHLMDAIEGINFNGLNLLKILQDVACGMEYLAEKKYLHRDLACRNVFLNTKKECKIGDFKFCVYVGDTNGIYPDTECLINLDYTSPETGLSKQFTFANDVWTMGILCWELFYIAEHANQLPPSLVTTQYRLRQFRQAGSQLPKSKLCPKRLHLYVIENLLNANPAKRPTFTSVKKEISDIISNKNY